MLKKRIIPLLLHANKRLYKSIGFSELRDVGFPSTAVRIYSSQDADEVIVLNIERSEKHIEPFVDVIKTLSSEALMPLCAGGGVNGFDDARALIAAGADKVVLNTAVYKNKALIQKIAECFGRQAVVIGIDARFDPERQDYVLYSCNGTKKEEVSLRQHIFDCDTMGAGEFLIQSIDHDGLMKGFDHSLLTRALSTTTRPVIGGGGSGDYSHIINSFIQNPSLSGLACGSIFNFTDSNPVRASAALANAGFPVKRV